MFLAGDRVRDTRLDKTGTVKDWYVPVSGPPNGGLICRVRWDDRTVTEINEHYLAKAT